MVGVVNTLVDIGLFALLFYQAQLHLLVANSISYSIGVLNSFVLNKWWTFDDSTAWSSSLPRIVLFAGFNVLGLAWTNLIIWLLAQVLPALAAKCGAVAAVFAWNYWTSHRFVFVQMTPPSSIPSRFSASAADPSHEP
jgi:putative flippase GtrA